MTALVVNNGLESELASTGAKFTTVELRLPEDLPESDWAAIGRKLLRADQVMQWWIGDWALFGAGCQDKQGWRKNGALSEFCRANGIDYGNARNKAWVSGAVHLSLRRDNVRWSYFQELAPLKPKEQKAWLRKIEIGLISVSDLRRAIRISQGETNALVSDGPVLEFGTKYFDELRAWLKARPSEFWEPRRVEIWRERVREIDLLIPDVTTS